MGMNERATPEAQLWVIMAQIREELELRSRAEVLVLDRALIDNFAYFLRATKGQDPFDVTPLVARWSDTYDLYVRLRPETLDLGLGEELHVVGTLDVTGRGQTVGGCQHGSVIGLTISEPTRRSPKLRNVASQIV